MVVDWYARISRLVCGMRVLGDWYARIDRYWHTVCQHARVVLTREYTRISRLGYGLRSAAISSAVLCVCVCVCN